MFFWQDSLGGNSKTTMIATVSPSSWYEAFLKQIACILSAAAP
jgi:hypothetical protein